MRNLDVATLRSLQAVAEYGAVTRAAEALNMTQSAMSMQMKRLEDVFGQALLLKQGRGVVLSDFGEELLGEARKMVAINDSIVARFTGVSPKGRLRVGISSDWLFERVAQAVRAFRQSNPEIELVIDYARSSDLRAQMKRGDHDLILVTEFEAPPGATHLAKVEIVWAGAVGGEAWKQRPLPIANTTLCAYHPVGMAALEKAGIDWTLVAGQGGHDTWHVLAVADLGVTIKLCGVPLAGLETIEHGGALPPLPPTWMNVYYADGPARAIAAEFTGYLRHAICEVAALAA